MLSATEKQLVPKLIEKRAEGMSLLDAVKYLRAEHGLSLGDAQRVAALSRVWEPEQACADELTKEFLDEAARREVP